MIELSGSPTPPARPDLPGPVVVREAADDVLDAAAADLLIQAKNCVRAFGDFHLAVSVTPLTEPLLRRLMYDPALRDLPWKRTHLWITDERAVGGDEESRFELLRQLVVEQSDMPAEQAHAIRAAEVEPDRRYEADLREHLAWREKGHDRLDFVLLGLGDNAGIAGLQPGTGADTDPGRLAVIAGLARDERSAITLTLTMINAARFIAVLATGPERRGAIAEVGAARRRRVGSAEATPPAGRLLPLAGELRWYLDHEALPRP
ncbi:MAG: 6-phosphogluconolactonase [Phycisphaerales bacterium]|nr:6-phosphogluconolactonase [Phycisphaerales bacterium]